MKFNLIERKVGQTSYIRLSISYQGRQVKWQTGITTKAGNFKDKRITSKDANYKHKNQILSNILKEAESKFYELSVQGPVKVTDIITHLNERFRGVQNKPDTFYTFLDAFIQERAQDSRFAYSTVQTYRLLQKHLKAYRTHLDFNDFEVSFFDAWIRFLSDPKKGMAKNYISKLAATLRMVLNYAEESGYQVNKGYKSKRATVSREPANDIYLNLDELSRIERLKGLSERLERVRALFLLLAFTGQRFSDLGKLRPENVNASGLLVITQKKGKTVRPVYIPIHPIVESIFASGVPSMLSSQKFNDGAKELCQLAGIKERVSITRTEGGKKVTRVFEKWQLVSSHTGRRSFATNAYLSGEFDTLSIMAITGHQTEKEFLKYIKARPEEHALKISGNRFFKAG